MKEYFGAAKWLILSGFLKAVYDLVDAVFIRNGGNMGVNLSALGISWPVINMIYAINVCVIIGGNIYMGKNKEKDSTAFVMVFVASFLAGAIMSFLTFFTAEFTLKKMGATGEILKEATWYLKGRSLACIFTAIVSGYGVIKQQKKDTLRPLVLFAVAILLDSLSTYILVVKLRLGLFGAGLARFIADGVLVPNNCWDLFKDSPFKLSSFFTERFAKNTIKNSNMISNIISIFRLGFFAGISHFMTSFGFWILQGGILSLGAEYSAAFGIGNKIVNLILLPVSSQSTLLTTFSTQGKRAYKYSRNLTLLLCFIGAGTLFLAQSRFFGFLTEDEKVRAQCIKYCAAIVITLPFLGMFNHYQAYLNGIGKTKLCMLYSLAWLWLLRIPMLIFTLNYMPDFLWNSLAISNAAIGIIGSIIVKKI